MTKDKDFNKKIKELLQCGWIYKQGKHIKLYSPTSGRLVVVSRSPSDKRAYFNFLKDIKRVSLAV